MLKDFPLEIAAECFETRKRNRLKEKLFEENWTGSD